MFSCNFETTLYKWISKSVKNTPKEVVAFSFNLYDDNREFSVEIIGASSFDPNDSDWACDEIYRPKKDKINIPKSFAGTDWELCLEKLNKLVTKYLNSSHSGSIILNQSKGIGVGFVDGDLVLIKTKINNT
jgi:hypothetical protein